LGGSGTEELELDNIVLINLGGGTSDTPEGWVFSSVAGQKIPIYFIIFGNKTIHFASIFSKHIG